MLMPDHIVIVIEENHDKDQIVGNPYAPFINALIKHGLYYSNAHGTDLPQLYQPAGHERRSGNRAIAQWQ
jgi:acid phosphatase